jgi:hypothetical protein
MDLISKQKSSFTFRSLNAETGKYTKNKTPKSLRRLSPSESERPTEARRARLRAELLAQAPLKMPTRTIIDTDTGEIKTVPSP